jgi:o-succinylbenzoate synthase
MKIEIIPRTLHFKFRAGTSRGYYTTHDVWYLKGTNINGEVGYGECAPLADLSCDCVPDYEDVLSEACEEASETGCVPYERYRDYPSVLFGIETMMQHLSCKSAALWNTAFSRGEQGIAINGLIWMGSKEEMMSRIEQKLNDGFHCIKVKIGAIDFDDEFALLQYIRSRYSRAEVELRVDANGGFTPEEAPRRLEQLASLDIHSIEQPIRQHQWQSMAKLCANTPLPIALDEELIGLNSIPERSDMLDEIHPQYIIIKPTLHGGFHGSESWIQEAEERHIGWWITSALESNIGLNAIAQFCAEHDTVMPQGLGTGLLYTDNIPSPLEVRGDKLWYNPSGEWRVDL